MFPISPQIVNLFKLLESFFEGRRIPVSAPKIDFSKNLIEPVIVRFYGEALLTLLDGARKVLTFEILIRSFNIGTYLGGILGGTGNGDERKDYGKGESEGFESGGKGCPSLWIHARPKLLPSKKSNM
jgi:hypothetical protein